MPYLTRTQAMEHLHIRSKKLRQLTTARKIPFYQEAPGSKMLFDEADLNRYMESLRVTTKPVSVGGTLRKQRARSA